MRAIVLSACACVFALLCGGARADPERGLEIAERWCNGCHIVLQKDAGQDDGQAAPRFSTLTRHTLQSLGATLRKGHAGMEALRQIPDSDIADIAAHLHRLKPEDP